MKKGGIIVCLCFVVLHLLKLFSLSFIESDYGNGRIEAYLNVPMDYASFSLQDGYARLLPAVMGKQQGKMKVKTEREVEIIATNWRLYEIEPIAMDNGSFFGEAATYEGRDVVVISDTLALELFGSSKATGNVCKIDGIDYQIVGVYTQDKGLKKTLFDRGKQRIYLPITSTVGKKSQVECVLLTHLPDEKKMDVKDLMTLNITDFDATLYDGTDYVQRLKALVNGSLTYLGILFLIKTVRRSIKLAKNWQVERNYVQIAFYASGGIVIFMLLVRRIYMPSGFLPPYNIFDGNHYIAYVKDQLVLHNQMRGYTFTNFEAFFWLIRKWSIVFTLIQMVISFKLSSYLIGQMDMSKIDFHFKRQKRAT